MKTYKIEMDERKRSIFSAISCAAILIFMVVFGMTFSKTESHENDRSSVEKIIFDTLVSAEAGDMIVAGNENKQMYFLGILRDKPKADSLCLNFHAKSPIIGANYRPTTDRKLAFLIGNNGFVYRVPKEKVREYLQSVFISPKTLYPLNEEGG